MGFFDNIGDKISSFGENFIGGLLKPDNLINAVGLYASSKQQADQQQSSLDAASTLAQQKFNQDLQLLTLQHQYEMEKAGAGGGGGGVGAALAQAQLALKRKELAQAKAIAQYNAVSEGRRAAMDSTQRAAEFKQSALQNLMSGASAPLLRGR